MTQVHNRLAWREKAAMTLQHIEGQARKPKNIPRHLIMSVRRLARKAWSAEDIIAELDLDMSPKTFRRKCRELQITLHANRSCQYLGRSR